jgi:chromosome segregation ATPase
MEPQWSRYQKYEPQFNPSDSTVMGNAKNYSPGQHSYSELESMRLSTETPSIVQNQLNKILYISKELKERELEISSLQRELANMVSYKEQYTNMKAQLNLYKEKLAYYERISNDQTLKLHELENSYRPKALALEKEIEELKVGNNKLQGEISLMRLELEKKESYGSEITAELKGKNATIKKMREETFLLQQKLQKNSEFEKEFIKEKENFQGAVQEKEEIIQALEKDNDKLRKELERAMESLANCQVELRFIPKLRQDIKQSANLINAASSEIDKEKAESQRLLTELKDYEKRWRKIRTICENNEPIEYIEDLKNQLQFNIEKFAAIQSELQATEQRHDKSLNQLKNKLEKVSLSIPKHEEAFRELSLQKKRMEEELQNVIQDNTRLTQRNEELKVLASQYKQIEKEFEVIKFENDKLIQKGEEMKEIAFSYKKLQKELEILCSENAKLQPKSEELKDLRIQYTKLEREYESIIGENKRLSARNEELCYKLEMITSNWERADKNVKEILEVLASEGVNIEAAGILEVTANIHRILLHLLRKSKRDESELTSLREELESLKSSGLRDKVMYSQASVEYSQRMLEMRKNIETLSKVIEENEKHSLDILYKYQQASRELSEAKAELSILRDKEKRESS